MAGISAAFEQLAQNDQAMGADLRATIERSEALEQQLASVPEILNRFEEAGTAARLAIKDEMGERMDKVGAEVEKIGADVNDKFSDIKAELARSDERGISIGGKINLALTLGALGIATGIGGLIAALMMR